MQSLALYHNHVHEAADEERCKVWETKIATQQPRSQRRKLRRPLFKKERKR